MLNLYFIVFLVLEAGILFVFVRQMIIWNIQDKRDETIERERNKRLDALAKKWDKLAVYLDERGVHPLEHFLQIMNDSQWNAILEDMRKEREEHVDA